MIGLFLNKRGYITGFTLIVSLLLISSVFLSINTGKYYFEQNHIENAADSIALSLATWESRGLNVIAMLNYGMERSIRYIRIVLMLWVASIGVALYGNPSLFFHLSRKAPGIIQKLWNAGVKFSKMAKRVKNAIPLLLLSCFRKLLKYYGIHGFIYPSLPFSEKKNDVALRLHLKDGEPLSIIQILHEAKGKARSYKPKNRFKRFFYKVLTRIFFSSIRFLFNLKGEIIPQVMEEDFHEKQMIYFFGYSGRRKPFLNNIFQEKYRNYAVSCAKPDGGTSYDARWKSRRIKPKSDTTKIFGKGVPYGF